MSKKDEVREQPSTQYDTMQATQPEKAAPLNIRLKTDQRILIEQAAKVTGKTVSDFVRDVTLREAQDRLLDQHLFQLDGDAWDDFNAALDQSPSKNTRLHDLMHRKAVWD